MAAQIDHRRSEFARVAYRERLCRVAPRFAQRPQRADLGVHRLVGEARGENSSRIGAGRASVADEHCERAVERDDRSPRTGSLSDDEHLAGPFEVFARAMESAPAQTHRRLAELFAAGWNSTAAQSKGAAQWIGRDAGL